MKAAIHYAIARETYRADYYVLAVTSEGPGRRVNGRKPNGEPTHVRAHDAIGKFASFDAANAVVEQIVEIKKRYEANRKPLERGVRELYEQEAGEIALLLKAKGAV